MTNEEIAELEGFVEELLDPCATSGANKMGALLKKLLDERSPVEPASEPVSAGFVPACEHGWAMNVSCMECDRLIFATVNDVHDLSTEINALPDHLRRFIRDLELRADPAGDVRRAHIAEQKVAELTAKLEECQTQLGSTKRT